jgi:MtaA/CmuA family methyltransferase
MRPEQWNMFKRAARLEKLERVPMALIVDSPWIPGYLGVSHADYYLDPELWFQSNLRIYREFPEIIFVPSWWMEYGMAAEPSALGVKMKFWQKNTPGVQHTLNRIEDIEQFPHCDVETDSFMGLTLHRIRMARQRVLDEGEILPLVTSRGPLTTAGFVRNTTDFMIDIIEKPDWAHRLIGMCTDLIIDWLNAQHRAMGDTVEGIFILDDVVGFLNEKHYMEFAHPYLKKICDSFPKEWIKVYHNDADIRACLNHIPECGFNVLNWGTKPDVAEVQARVGGRLCLMGNVNPLEPGVRGTPEDVATATLEVLDKTRGQGIILSLGGGVSPGMPGQNIQAMVEAVSRFNARPAA